nr:hypothetical protein [uncultured Mediterranean phage uvMED]
MIDKYIIKFLTFLDNLFEVIGKLFTKTKKKRK